MPQIILDDLAQSQVSIFCAQTQRGELGSRMQMSAVVNKKRIRHAHMVNISRQIMLEGMRADFNAVDELSQRLIERARQARRISCRTPSGTDFEAELSPKQMAEDERNYCRINGRPSGWRNFHIS
jgi:leucyl aminopeptidase (aminopeptidase T)